MPTTRRELIKLGGLGVSLSILAPQILVPKAFGSELDTATARVLVVLQLAGGNDSINTVIPYTDSRYRSLRPTLAIPDAEILKVDSALGFHPAMQRLVPLYEQRRCAFVNNVGFATLDRSHFHCQDVWQTGSEHVGHGGHGDGWLGRYADLYLGEGATSVTSVSIGSSVPLGMQSDAVFAAAISDPDGFDIATHGRRTSEIERFRASLREVYGVGREMHPEMIRMQGDDMFETIDLVKTLPDSNGTVEYPASNLGSAFSLAARIIASDFGTRAIWIKTGGFDTHAVQANLHANLLTDVSNSLAAFHADLFARGLSDRAIVMAWSEFGRRVQENASGGTDHGKAGTVMLLGDRIDGGRMYGELPRLDDLDQGDLPTEIDFRSVYWTILEDWMGVDPEPVLGGVYENLGFVGAIPGGRRRSVRR